MIALLSGLTVDLVYRLHMADSKGRYIRLLQFARTCLGIRVGGLAAMIPAGSLRRFPEAGWDSGA